MKRSRLLEISRAAATGSPVAIVGAVRTGTSILYRALQLQESFALGPGCRGGEGEVDLTESTILRDAGSLLDIESEEAHLARQFLLFDPASVTRVAEAARALPGWRRGLLARTARLRARNHATRRRDLAWRMGWGHHLLRIYFDAARRGRGVTRVVEKTPDHFKLLPELRAAFPHARVIFCVRHPVTTYASVRRRARRREKLGVENEANGIFGMDSRRYVASHREAARAGLREKRTRPDGLLFVRFEDLTADPEKTLLRVGDFLGESFTADRLPGTLASGWHSEEDPLLSGPIVERTYDWREYVSEAEALEIEERLSDQLAAFGYRSVVGDAPGTSVGEL
ncbi:MAG: sulfotransferase [Deltaproteobacteria bacterium]|nr:sulfotransferase [Deltaproteobacteria bacterium]